MGYTTEFEGSFELNKKLADDHREYLQKFAETRRIGRITTNLPKERKCIIPQQLLEKEVEGEYFVDDETSAIIDYNVPPKTQPGLWCQWVPNPEGTEILWDSNEKFYNYEEWIQYIITNFLDPFGYKLNGTVTWHGEDSEDHGQIVITDNNVEVKQGVVRYG